MQLPIGVFGVAVATVALPAMSRAATSGITKEFKHTLHNGLGLIGFLVLPSTLVLVMLAEPVISVIYERGNFAAHDRIQTAIALRSYGYGLLFYAAAKIIQPAFYAIDRRWVPMIVSLCSVGINFGLNWYFVFKLGWGHGALALTSSVIATINFLALFICMRVTLISKLAVAGVVLSTICFYGNDLLLQDPGSLPILQRLGFLILVTGIAGIGYLVTCHLLRVSEVREAVQIVTRRFKP